MEVNIPPEAKPGPLPSPLFGGGGPSTSAPVPRLREWPASLLVGQVCSNTEVAMVMAVRGGGLWRRLGLPGHNFLWQLAQEGQHLVRWNLKFEIFSETVPVKVRETVPEIFSTSSDLLRESSRDISQDSSRESSRDSSRDRQLQTVPNKCSTDKNDSVFLSDVSVIHVFQRQLFKRFISDTYGFNSGSWLRVSTFQSKH